MEAGSHLSPCGLVLLGSDRHGRVRKAGGLRLAVAVASFWLVAFAVNSTHAADQRTQNFLVHANTPGMANAVAEAAEKYRHDLAMHWLGKPLPPWPAPCPIRVVDGPNLAAQGVTTYNPRPVRDFQMEVIGTPERILDSVLPHEVTHTILATHFGRPLPRWADEGICTTVEHAAERNKHEAKLREFLRSRRGIAMNDLFLMTEYPRDVLPMYAQGYSVCRFLIAQKGPRTFIQFLQDYMRQGSWTANIQRHYGYDSLRELQEYWLAWVDQGSSDVSKYSKLPSPSQDDSPRLAVGPSTTTGPAVSMALNGPRGQSVIAPKGPPAETLASNERVRGTAVTGDTEGGWYLRRRAGASGRRETAPPPPPEKTTPGAGRTPILPPSVRDSGRYSVAQPQPEQRISRSELPTRGGWPTRSGRIR